MKTNKTYYSRSLTLRSVLGILTRAYFGSERMPGTAVAQERDEQVSIPHLRTIPSVRSGENLEAFGLVVLVAIVIAGLACGLVTLAL